MTKEQLAEWLLKHGFSFNPNHDVYSKGVVSVEFTDKKAYLSVETGGMLRIVSRARFEDLHVNDVDQLKGLGIDGFRSVKEVVYNA